MSIARGHTASGGLPILATGTMVLHIVIMFIFPKIADRLPRRGSIATTLRRLLGGGLMVLPALRRPTFGDDPPLCLA